MRLWYREKEEIWEALNAENGHVWHSFDKEWKICYRTKAGENLVPKDVSKKAHSEDYSIGFYGFQGVGEHYSQVGGVPQPVTWFWLELRIYKRGLRQAAVTNSTTYRVYAGTDDDEYQDIFYALVSLTWSDWFNSQGLKGDDNDGYKWNINTYERWLRTIDPIEALVHEVAQFWAQHPRFLDFFWGSSQILGL